MSNVMRSRITLRLKISARVVLVGGGEEEPASSELERKCKVETVSISNSF